jgi:23S rRNA pseudouridine955/2504/2580 synthase
VAKRLWVPPASPAGSAPPEGAGPARGGPAPGRAWATLLDVTIKTGRTHQIRAHLAQNGHAIVGDPKYGDFAKNKTLAKSEAGFARMFLHARRLQFTHPATGQPLSCEAPLPADCLKLCATT